MTRKNLYLVRENITLAQNSGNYCCHCFWSKLLPTTFPSSCHSLLLMVLQLLFIFIISASLLLIHSQLSCSAQSIVLFLSNQCSVTNILFLLALPPPTLGGIYTFILLFPS